MSKPNYQAAADVLRGWRDDVLSGKPPTFYPIGDGELKRIEIGPGLVTLLAVRRERARRLHDASRGRCLVTDADAAGRGLQH